MSYTDSEKAFLTSLANDATCKAHKRKTLLSAIEDGKQILALKSKTEGCIYDLLIVQPGEDVERVTRQFFTFFGLKKNDWSLEPIEFP